jgi:uncharacterized damage-inducible protein DinB
MEVRELFIANWKRESELTRKMLERVPDDKLSWKPHDKSKTLGALAQHVASLPGRMSYILELDVFDPRLIVQPELTDKAGVLKTFDEGNARFADRLNKSKDEDYSKDFTFSPGGKPQFTTSKAMGLSALLFGHITHHRAQLSVYLRLLDVPVPGMYGPTADE